MKLAFILKGDIPRKAQFLQEYARVEAAFPDADIALLESERPGQARELAAEACADRDFLVAVGGDGTLHEVLDGCLRTAAGNPALRIPALAVLAHGTANDTVRSLGIRGDVEELIRLLQQRSTRRIDAARLRCRDAAGEAVERFFLNVADIGIGADVVRRLGRPDPFLGSNLHYLRAVLKTFISFHPVALRAQSDLGLDWQGKALAVIAANGSYFGSGLCVAPGATVEDGQLVITLVGDAHIADFIRHLNQLRRGVRLEHPKVQYHHGRRLEVTHLDEPAGVEADGEFLGYTPAAVEILPRAITFLLPAAGEAGEE